MQTDPEVCKRGGARCSRRRTSCSARAGNCSRGTACSSRLPRRSRSSAKGLAGGQCVEAPPVSMRPARSPTSLGAASP
eukprot:2291472-Pyramimonas_sp.AAC.1